MFFRFFLAHRPRDILDADPLIRKSTSQYDTPALFLGSVYYVGTQVFVYSTRCLSPESYQAVEVSLTRQRDNACLHQLLCIVGWFMDPLRFVDAAVFTHLLLQGRCCDSFVATVVSSEVIFG